jgi:adenine-specific DNA-methyltransferase
MILNKLDVLIGDASGADKAVQAFFQDKGYRKVTVFCTAGACRNNLGAWKVEAVESPHRTRDFEFFTAKDAEMARRADFGLMLWDGKSSGTLVNVARLVSASKPAVLYVSPQHRFLTLKSRGGLQQVLDSAESEVRVRVTEYISEYAPEFMQPSVFQVG